MARLWSTDRQGWKTANKPLSERMSLLGINAQRNKTTIDGNIHLRLIHVISAHNIGFCREQKLHGHVRGNKMVCHTDHRHCRSCMCGNLYAIPSEPAMPYMEDRYLRTQCRHGLNFTGRFLPDAILWDMFRLRTIYIREF